MTPSTSSGRIRYLDWLRGLTVLIMIQAHTFDAWTLATERIRPGFGRLTLLAGMAAPLFLFLAGVAASLSGAAHMRRGSSRQEAARKVERRGWQLFFYAFLIRIQSYVLGGFVAPHSLLKVDILNVMGPAMSATAALWGAAGTRWRQGAVLVAATLALLGVTPWLRQTPLVASLPDPIEWYIRPPAGQGTFTLLPWAGFVLAGGVLGVGLDGATRSAWRPRRLQATIGAVGAGLIALGVLTATQPALFSGAYFWTTSPTFFAVRVGLMLLLVVAAWAWESRPWRRNHSPSPFEVLGLGSLFVYWVHVELVYGGAGRPLRHSLTLEQCGLAWAGFSLGLYALLLGWNQSRPTRLWLAEEAIKLLKSDSWTVTPLPKR